MKIFTRSGFAFAGVLSATCLMTCGAASPAATKVDILVANRGHVIVLLYPKAAPKTVAHFMALVKRKFYDGILIHRVVPGFVVQAGDVMTKTQPIDAPGIGSHGSGPNGSNDNIPFEENKFTNETGAVAMALSAPRSATGDSQWFINLVPNHRLDGDYCVFAKVAKGMDIVAKLKQGDKIVRIVVLTK